MAKLPPMSESELQFAILNLAALLGLLVHHCRPAQIRPGKWVTPIQGNKGFPDLVLCGPGGVLFRELKNDVLAPTPEQMRWLGTLELAGADVGIWRPAQWRDGTIQNALKALAAKKVTV